MALKYPSTEPVPVVDFIKRKIETPWLIRGLVPNYGISLIYADPKIGKSIFSAQLAHSLGTGKPFLENREVIGGPYRVLYLQTDLAEAEWLHQLETLGVSEGWDTLVLGAGDIVNPQWRDAIQRDLKERLKKYDFVIMDALTSLFNFPEITKPHQAGKLLKTLHDLYDPDKPLWVIHHKRKGSSGVPDTPNQAAAGSFALAAGVSTLYDLKRGGLTVMGRVVRADLELDRTTNGLWKELKPARRF